MARMDDGQVIPGLNENWTFAGAKPIEWLMGVAAGLLFTEFFISNTGRYIPVILLVIVGFPMAMATLRKSYPDEERGIRNHFMSMVGVAPPDIPKPAMLQPVWSGAPMHSQQEKLEFVTLGLEEVFPTKQLDEEEDELQGYMLDG